MTTAPQRFEPSPRLPCRAYAFEIERHPGRRSVGAEVQPRRIVVFAPDLESAQAGAGVAKDELSRRVPLHVMDYRTLLHRPGREELADFYDTIGNALVTGTNLTTALNMAARMSRNPRMRGIIGMLHTRIVHGEDLHAAMRHVPRLFSPMQLAMVEAAAATGLDRAGTLLVTLSRRLQKDGQLWRKLVSALAYPLSLIALTIVGAIVLEIWALPPMVELFRTLGGRLPPITQAFYSAARFLREHGALLLPLAIAAGAGLAWGGPRLMRMPWAERIAVRLPFVGAIVQWTALIRALGTFVLLKQSGAKVRDQFTMAAAAAGNSVIGRFFEACYTRIAAGESVEEAFTAERHRLGDDGIRLAGKMEIGMAGADLSVLIGRIVEELSDRAELRLNALPNAIRWPLLTICCGLIGSVALAIVLPYPNLVADVAHQQSAVMR